MLLLMLLGLLLLQLLLLLLHQPGVGCRMCAGPGGVAEDRLAVVADGADHLVGGVLGLGGS